MKWIVMLSSGENHEFDEVHFKASGWILCYDGDAHTEPNPKHYWPDHAVDRVDQVPEEDE